MEEGGGDSLCNWEHEGLSIIISIVLPSNKDALQALSIARIFLMSTFIIHILVSEKHLFRRLLSEVPLLCITILPTYAPLATIK